MFNVFRISKQVLLFLLFSSFLRCTCSAKIFEQSAGTDLPLKAFEENDLDVWQAPAEFRKIFTYYWSGFDEECRPIWVGELGKWDVRRIIERGEDSQRTLLKYVEQGVYRLVESLKFNNTDCPPSHEIVGILDVDGFNYFQMASTSTVAYTLNIAKDYIPLLMKHVHSIYFVNANFAANGIVNLARPILGEFMARVEVYGTRKSTWLPALLKKLPRGQLPEKLGGKKGFIPLKLYD